MIRAVSYREILDASNWQELLDEYAQECASYELGPPRPQRELYEKLEASGGFQAFGVYDQDALVGFATVLIYVLPHFGIKVATSESIFVTAEFRYLSTCLLDSLKNYARGMLCADFLYSAPVGSQFDRVLSHRLRHTNNVYLETL